MSPARARVLWITAIVSTLAVGIALVNLVLPSSTLVIHGTYETFEDALRAGLRDKGWMPEFMPQSAHQIRETHDLDRNMSWGSFAYSRIDESRLRAQMAQVGPATAVDLPERPYPDWPLNSHGTTCSGELIRQGIDLLWFEDPPSKTVRRTYAVALIPARSQVAYWTIAHAPSKPCATSPD